MADECKERKRDIRRWVGIYILQNKGKRRKTRKMGMG
jgi:hypothetical protein